MAYRARNILIAVALAAVAALLTSFYVTSYKRHVQRGEDHVTVLVAKKDIAVGASGADVAGQLSSQDVPRKSVVPGAISSTDQLAGLVATEPTLEGEQVTTRRFSPRAHVGVRAQLSGTLRAVSLEGDQNQLLAGTLKDGDSVDFVAALKYHKSGSTRTVYFEPRVVRDLKVLQAPAAPPPGSKLTGCGELGLRRDAGPDRQPGPEAPVHADARRRRPYRRRAVAPRAPLRSRTTADSPDSLDSFESVLTGGLRASAAAKLRRRR